MSTPPVDPGEVVSARVYAAILGSPRLRQQLLPEGPFRNPYEILDYRSVLVLEDRNGTRAVFRRTQRIRFLQDGVGAILDHFWGDGVLVVEYAHSAGRVADSFKDAGRRHLVIELPQPMRRGEELRFTVRRTVLGGFGRQREQVETTIDHPIARLSRTVVFPAARPCRGAALQSGSRGQRLAIAASGGVTRVRVHVADPRPHTPYTLRWSW